MSYVLGLTGSIATGKSTVSHYFVQKGYPLIDADLIAKEVVEPRTPGLARVVSHFGSKILTETGELNRKALGEIVFNNPNDKSILEEILHGEIKEIINKRLEKYKIEGHLLIVLDIPLLFETGYRPICDEVITVFVSPRTQLKRLIKRDDLSKKQAETRIDNQMSIIDKTLRADTIIDNEGTKDNTRLQVDRWLLLFGQYLKDLTKKDEK